MIPTTPATPATRALLADIDRRNRAFHADAVLRERIRGLITAYLAPAPRAAALVSIEPPPVVDGRQRMASDRRAAG